MQIRFILSEQLYDGPHGGEYIMLDTKYNNKYYVEFKEFCDDICGIKLSLDIKFFDKEQKPSDEDIIDIIMPSMKDLTYYLLYAQNKEDRKNRILRNAIYAYESELDTQGYENEEEMHKVLLNKFGMTESEYMEVMNERSREND